MDYEIISLVNIHCIVWMFFCIHWQNQMISKDHFIQFTSSSRGSVLGNINLGAVFLDTLPQMYIRRTSSHGKNTLAILQLWCIYNADIFQEYQIHPKHPSPQQCMDTKWRHTIVSERERGQLKAFISVRFQPLVRSSVNSLVPPFSFFSQQFPPQNKLIRSSDFQRVRFA